MFFFGILYIWAQALFYQKQINNIAMMNKASLVENLQTKHDLTKAQAEQMVDDIFDSIIQEVKKGDTVSIAGFGIFEAKQRAARMGRNPKTGEAIQIKASVNPKFRPAKAFKDAVN